MDGMAVVFPGQGSQTPGMADPWMSDPLGAEVIEEASAVLGRDIAAGSRDPAALATTAFAQPALLACEVAAWRIAEAAGLRPIAGAGHSLGEFAALVATGTLTLSDAIAVVTVRGEAMQRAGDEHPGAMTALLGVDSATAAELCDEARGDGVLMVANENSPQQVVASGSVDSISRLEGICGDRKIRAVRLQVAGAFHSPLMEPAVAPLNEAIARATFSPGTFPVASNVTGGLVSDPAEMRELLGRHVVSPVRWESCVAALLGAGASTFVELGPGDVLTKLAKRVAPGAGAVSAGDPEAVRALASA